VNNSQPNNGQTSPIEEESKENPPVLAQNERFQYMNDREDLQTMHGDLRIRKKKNKEQPGVTTGTNTTPAIPVITGMAGMTGTARQEGTEITRVEAGSELAEKTKKVESNNDEHLANHRHTHQRMVIHGQNFYQPSTDPTNNHNNRGLGLHRPHHNEMILNNNEQNTRHGPHSLHGLHGHHGIHSHHGHHGHHGHVRPSTANQASQSRESRGINALRLLAEMQNQPQQSGGGSQQQQQRRQQQPKKTGKPATKQQIERLPIRKIDLEFLKEKSLTTEDYTKCSICIGEYQNEEEVRTLPCLHYFHKECIDQWLQKNRVCPICKTSILSY